MSDEAKSKWAPISPGYLQDTQGMIRWLDKVLMFDETTGQLKFEPVPLPKIEVVEGGKPPKVIN